MLTIIGCGNLNRSDDAVGVLVARRLIQRLDRHPVEGVRVFDCGTGGMEVMFKARGSAALLILDAATSGAPPGTIYDVPGAELERPYEPVFSLHDFRWEHALAAGRRIFKDDFPREVRVWLVEAKELGLGLELSAEVTKAAESLYQRALAHVADYAARRHAQEQPFELTVRRGNIQIDRKLFDRYFGQRSSAILINRDSELLLMPVDPIAGGVLVKQRNLQGDRSIDASEFLRARGLNEQIDMTCTARWNHQLGGLALAMPKEHP